VRLGNSPGFPPGKIPRQCKRVRAFGHFFSGPGSCTRKKITSQIKVKGPAASFARRRQKKKKQVKSSIGRLKNLKKSKKKIFPPKGFY